MQHSVTEILVSDTQWTPGTPFPLHSVSGTMHARYQEEYPNFLNIGACIISVKLFCIQCIMQDSQAITDVINILSGFITYSKPNEAMLCTNWTTNCIRVTTHWEQKHKLLGRTKLFELQTNKVCQAIPCVTKNSCVTFKLAK